MTTTVELERLRELAADRTSALATPRLLELAAELSLLERCMEARGETPMVIAEAKFRHAATNEAGAWSFDFVRRLVRLGLVGLGEPAMERVPRHVLVPILGGVSGTLEKVFG